MYNKALLFVLAGIATVPLFAAKTNPQLLEAKPPAYPEQLKQKGEAGEAKIAITIDATGVVTEATVKSATDDAFGTAALEAVKTWRFKPAEEDGKPVAIKVVLPVQFPRPEPAQGAPAVSGKQLFNAEMGREVFVDASKITQKIHTYEDLKKWIPLQGKNGNRIPYPEELKGSGISEEIQIMCVISPEGYVLNPSIISIKNKQLAVPALRHIARVRFQVPKFEGKPVYAQQRVKLICSEDPNFGTKPKEN